MALCGGFIVPWSTVVMIICGALFSPAVIGNFLQVFGINFNAKQSQEIQKSIERDLIPVAQVVPPSTPAATPEPVKPPTPAQTVNDAVKNPTSLFGIAAVGFVAVFVIAQLRAAGHEAASGATAVYREGGKATRVLANADATTGNISRARR